MIILGGGNLHRFEFSLGVLVMLGSAASWALMGALIRKWLPDLPATFAVATVFTIVTPLFLVGSLILYGSIVVSAVPAGVWTLLIVSGLVSVGLGQSLYYRALPVLGIALSSSLGLLIPFLVGIASYLIFGERLVPTQLIGGAVLIFGSYLLIRIRFRTIS